MLVVTKNKPVDKPMPKLRHVRVHFYPAVRKCSEGSSDCSWPGDRYIIYICKIFHRSPPNTGRHLMASSTALQLDKSLWPC